MRKEGATSGLTGSKIWMKDTTLDVSNKLYKNQIITNYMSEPGDSGALGVVANNKKAFGLLIGGSPVSAVYNPIDKVLNALDVDIAMPVIKL